VKDEVLIQNSETYARLTIRMNGRGIVQRDRILGHQIGTKRQFIARAGQLVLSKIDARNGAFGILPTDCDNAIITGNFWAFDADSGRLLPEYIDALTKTRMFIEFCVRASEGTTNRRYLQEDAFLAQEIMLPTLTEQRRLVARIEELIAKIHEAKNLRRQASEEAHSLLASTSQRLFEPKAGWNTKTVGEFCDPPQYGYTATSTDQPVGPHLLRITDIQEGRVDWDRVPYCHCPDPAKYLLQRNDLVFARTGATTGKSFLIQDCPLAVFASYLIRLRVRSDVSIDYLYRYFQSASYWEQIADEKSGTGQPNLNGSKLAKLKVPIATEPEQRHIVAELNALKAEVDALEHLQAETSTELDALLPSVLSKAFAGEL
jgi:type I restriction enzyme S subunit